MFVSIVWDAHSFFLNICHEYAIPYLICVNI